MVVFTYQELAGEQNAPRLPMALDVLLQRLFLDESRKLPTLEPLLRPRFSSARVILKTYPAFSTHAGLKDYTLH